MIRVEKRSVVTTIVLSLITCGIYSIYLIYKQSEDINNLGGYTDSPAMELLLSLLTCGLYIFYWHYKYAKRVAQIQASNGLTVNDVSVLNVIISILGLELVAQAILQNEINNIIDANVGNDSAYL